MQWMRDEGSGNFLATYLFQKGISAGKKRVDFTWFLIS